jgi:DNA-binding CsgD family transcriptional regulator
MIEQRDDRRGAAMTAGRSPADGAAMPVGPVTPYERTLTWCILTLLSTHGAPSPGRPAPIAALPERSLSLHPESRLTNREIEVLGLVALGLTNAQIAARLFVSRRTIDQHLSSIYNRLGVSSRAAATRFAILNDLC